MKQRSKAANDGIVKATVRLPRSLWDAVRHRAIDEGCDAQEVVERALESYLRQKGGRQ